MAVEENGRRAENGEANGALPAAEGTTPNGVVAEKEEAVAKQKTKAAAAAHPPTVPSPAPKAVVTVTKTSRVLPSKLPEGSTTPVQLVTFDLPYITFYYNQKLLVYKSSSEDACSFEEAVERLKAGLAAALEHFYQLAGRLGKDEEGVLRVECEGENLIGVEVVEAAAEGVAVDDLAQGDAPEYMQEIVPNTGVMNLEGLERPLLAVQFTKLKDGLAIGCAFNHAILDGQSTWHFMGSWAELSRGSTTISTAPFLDRTKARNTRVKLPLPASAAEHERTDPTASNPNLKPLREKIFTFPGPAVSAIKSATNAALPAGSPPLSTFQSLGAHVWRAVCRARHLKPEDYTVFAIFIDCRRRIDPPVPESYFGNLIQAIFTVTAAGALQAAPVEYGADLLRQVIASHTAVAIDRRSSEWEADPKLFYYRDAGINCVAVGSSPRFRVYDVDFGFGRPEKVRSGSNNKFDGMMYLYQGKEGGGSIDIEITLDHDALRNLGEDEEFLAPVAEAAAAGAVQNGA